MVPEGWIDTNIGEHLIDTTLRNTENEFSHSDLRAVNKKHGMIPMKDRVKGKSVTRAKIVKKDWFAYNPMRINVGSICRWKSDKDCIVSPDYVVFDCNPLTLDTDFFDQFRKSHRWNKFMEDAGRGSVRIRIYLETLKQLKCYLPPLDEQQKIAEILSTWDIAIEATEKLIANSERQKKALMQQLLTGKKRLPGFSGEWETVPLTSAATIETGSSNRQDSLDEGEFTFFDRSTDVRRSDKYLFDTKAIIVGGEGQDFPPKYFEGKFDLHQRAYCIHKFDGFIPKYVFYELHYKRHLLKRFSVGSTVASLRMGTFKKIPLRKISIEEQESIVSVLDGSASNIQNLSNKLDCLKSEKAALMQQLLTGKRRVKIDEEMAA